MSDSANMGMVESFTGRMASLAKGLLRCGSVAAFRAAAPLPRDAQILIDNAVVKVGRDRLALVASLLAAGLIKNVPGWLGIPLLYWEKTSRHGRAKRTMIPKVRGERSVGRRSGAYLPLYCTWDDFSFGIREIMAAERSGMPLDTEGVEEATRNVNETIEDQALNGNGFNVDGNSAPGFLTNNVNNFQYTGGEAWTAHTGEEITSDILNMIDVLQANRYFGPYELVLGTEYSNFLNTDYKSATSGTIRSRIAEIDTGGGARLSVVTTDKLSANRVILYQKTSNVVDVVIGQMPTEISWEDDPGFERFFMILACAVVRVKTDYNGAQGWVVGDTVAH